MPFNFQTQLQPSLESESLLDTYFEGRGWEIDEATLEQEREHGYDRVFRKDGESYRVEYKVDTFDNLDAFLELQVCQLIGHEHKAGWVLHTKADFVMYLKRKSMKCYVLMPKVFQAKLPTLIQGKPIKVVDNGHYYGIGVTIPLDEILSGVYELLP